MSNGRPWEPRHTDILRRMAGSSPDSEIARRTGHATRTIRAHRKAMGLPAYIPGRRLWSRREWLMADAAGWACTTAVG